MTVEIPNESSTQSSTTIVPSKKFDFNALIERIKFVLKDPKGCWAVIKLELDEPTSLLKKYALPLLAASQLASYIKTSFIGVSVPFIGLWRAPPVTNLIHHAFRTALMVGMLYLAALIFEKLAPKFGGSAKFSDTFKLMVYSNTAGWLAGILIIVPFVGPLAALAGGLYGLYTLYNGISPMTNVPAERKVGYFIVTFIAMFLAGMIIFMTIGGIFTPEPPMNADLQKLQENFQKLIPGNQ